MLRNLLLVSFRHMARNKGFAFINIIGLALSMAAFVIIMQYVVFHKSFDQIALEESKIFRVESLFFKGDQQTDHWATSTNGYGPAMQANFPEVEDFTRIDWNNINMAVRYEEVKFRETKVCFADSNFFQFFNFPIIQGNPSTFLKDPNSIVISSSAAQRYFGQNDPIGKYLDLSTISKTYRCQVTGVFKDLPANSTMQFEFLISWETAPEWVRNFWYRHSSYTFVKLTSPEDAQHVSQKFPALAEQYKTGPALKDLTWGIELVSLADLHLNPAREYEIEIKGNRKAIGFLTISAFVILVIGWVNYINLSTTQAMNRTREAGVRKVMGSQRILLIFQCLLESLIVNCIALVLAIALVVGTHVWLPELLGQRIPWETGKIREIAILFGVLFLVGVGIAGFYPALMLSQIKPMLALKGKYTFSAQGSILRKVMVIVQFCASFILVTSTWIVYKQIQFMLQQDLGVQVNQVLVVKAPGNTEKYLEKAESFKEQLKKQAGITNVTTSGVVPGLQVGQYLANRKLHDTQENERLYETLMIDYDFVPTYNLQLATGRNFDRNRPTDQRGLLLNESAVKQFGFASNEAAIGEKIWLEANHGQPNEIIGVVKDYHQQSLQRDFTPIILCMDPDYQWIPKEFFSISLSSAHAEAVVSKVDQQWEQFFPESSFDYFFLDDFFNQQYQQDQQFGRIFLIFSTLVIIIACMGLFGLTSYMTTYRLKEVGIRKVLGASIVQILSQLSKDTIQLILVASLIATPVSIFLMTKWLQNYAFSISLHWWHFLAPALLLLLIALGTISYLTIKASLSNPAHVLKNE